jgi:hypothetical protein
MVISTESAFMVVAGVLRISSVSAFISQMFVQSTAQIIFIYKL